MWQYEFVWDADRVARGCVRASLVRRLPTHHASRSLSLDEGLPRSVTLAARFRRCLGPRWAAPATCGAGRADHGMRRSPRGARERERVSARVRVDIW